MNEKLVANLTIAIFAICTLAIVVPAQAHFTLGNLSGMSSYDVNNFDPHVAGPIGYVWSCSGENAYSGSPNVTNDNPNDARLPRFSSLLSRCLCPLGIHVDPIALSADSAELLSRFRLESHLDQESVLID